MRRGWPTIDQLRATAAPEQLAEIERAQRELDRPRSVQTAPPKRREVKRAKSPAIPLSAPNLPWAFTILGVPRTKNTGKSPHPGVVIPSAAYRRWYHAAMEQIPLIRQACSGTCSAPVDVSAVFYRDRDQGDEDRYCIALGDWLQRSGLVLNDSLIHWTGDTRRELDRANPRIEVCITLSNKQES